MATTTKFEINGVIDTSQAVLENINTLANASGVFVTWDPSRGTWSVIKNDVGSAVMNFNDSNIIGNINVSGSGINDMYNAVTIEYPHQDLRDTRDYIDLEIPTEQRYPQELDNRLEIKLDCINNPVQAQLIASRELKQSRVDKVITFSTSYLGNGLSAGDLISVTSTMYAYTAKVFRIITIQEDDTDDSGIVYQITALEYDADVYSTEGLVRKERNKKTGIVPKNANQPILVEDAAGTGNELARLLAALGINGLLSLLNGGSSATAGIAGLTPFVVSHSVSEVQSTFNAIAGTTGYPATAFQGDPTGTAQGVVGSFVLNAPQKYLIVIFTGALSTYDFDAAVGAQTGFTAYIPSQIEIIGENLARYGTFTVDWQTNNTIAVLENVPAQTYAYAIRPLPTYDLNMKPDFRVWPKNHSVIANASGAGLSITLLGFNI
jgi:hypothetical protein